MTLQVDLVSPENIVYSGEATMVIARTVGGGEIAFMTGHIPFLGALDVCVVRVKLLDGSEARFAVFGGFVEVSHDHVSILSDAAKSAEDIDLVAAEAALADARQRAAADPDDEDAARAVAEAEVSVVAAEVQQHRHTTH